MGIVETIKKAFGSVSKLMNVVMIFFLFNAIVGLISVPITNPDRAGNPAVIAISVISSLLFFLMFIFLQGGALGMVKDQIKTGAFSINNFADYGKKYYVRIFVLLLMYLLIAIGVVLLLSLISAGILLLGDNAFSRGLVAAIVSLAAIGAITFLIYPIYSLVADDLGSFDALKKGVAVAKDNFMKTLGLFLVMLIISVTISLIVGFIIGIITVPLGQTFSQIVIAIVNAAVQSYIPLVMMVAFMSFYMILNTSNTSSSQKQ